ncbi:MAG: hypothetical protein ABWX65_09140 [Mycetocola sp.]
MSVPLLHRSLIAYNGYDSGLGNRVRVVLGCKSLAALEDREFFYVWPTGPLFGPRFSDLWQVTGKTVSRATSRALARLYPYHDETLSWIDEDARRERLWQVRTGSPIQLPQEATPWQDEFRALQPVQEITDRVNEIYDRELRGAPYVGVMIRAHSVSHLKTLQTSPVDWFVERMSRIRAADPEVRFFVSCDVPEVQERVMSLVPGCIGQVDKGPYNSTAAVRASIVDLYLLASSGYLLGPHFSSFIHLAEHLAGDRLTLETPVTATGDAATEYRSHGVAGDPTRPFLRDLAGQVGR